MTNSRPIHTSNLSNLDSLISYDSRSFEEFHQDLRRILSRYGCEEIFARPETSDDGQIYWHAPFPVDEGADVMPLQADATASGEAARQRLRQCLDRLDARLEDDVEGRILFKALTVESPRAILSVNGRPVIAGWGLVPKGLLKNPEGLQRHFEQTLAPYMSRGSTPFIGERVEHVHTGDGGPTAGAGAAALPPGVVVENLPWWRRLGMALPLFLFALLVLLFLLLPGVLHYLRPAVAGVSSADDEAIAQSLREQIARYERMLEGDVCDPARQSRHVVPPAQGGAAAGGATTEDGGGDAAGDEAGGETDVATADPAVPVNPREAEVPENALPEGVPRPRNLLELLDAAVVLVIAKDAVGSGFFIAPDLIVTNAHVVKKPYENDRVFVTNKALGQITPAQIVARTRNSKPGKPDFALLKLSDGRKVDRWLALTTKVSRLQFVIAAGYPGVIIETDRDFHALVSGENRAAVPQVATTRGEVVVIQDWGDGVKGIVHRASISPGNSGGPLVDECGQVVGVNTFVQQGSGGADNQFYSLSTETLLAFLREHDVTPHVSEGQCSPRTAGANGAAGSAGSGGEAQAGGGAPREGRSRNAPSPQPSPQRQDGAAGQAPRGATPSKPPSSRGTGN